MKGSAKNNIAIKDIGKFFDIHKYAKAEKFTALQWSWQLIFRRMMFVYLDAGEEKISNSEIDFDLLIMQILSNPIARTDHTAPVLRKKSWRSVRDLRLLDMHWMHETAATKESLQQALAEIKAFDADYSVDKKIPELLDKGFQDFSNENKLGFPEGVVIVDLMSTDETILSDFEAWLKQKRSIFRENRDFQPPTQFTQADFNRWHKMAVLGYLDLKLFSNHFNIHIPDHVIGQLLFPNAQDFDSTERVKKTVRPLATQLSNNGFLDALEGQAAADVRLKGMNSY